MNATADIHWKIRLLRAVNRFYLRAFHHVDVVTMPPFPRTGAAIIACNHISGLDPQVLQAVIIRPIVWMVAREYYEQPGLARMFKLLSAIPVDRNGKDSGALRAALRTLKAGGVLGVFPEGKINLTPRLLPLQPGVGLIAARSGAPVYVAHVAGTVRGKGMAATFFWPHQLRMGITGPVASEPEAPTRIAPAPGPTDATDTTGATDATGATDTTGASGAGRPGTIKLETKGLTSPTPGDAKGETSGANSRLGTDMRPSPGRKTPNVVPDADEITRLISRYMRRTARVVDKIEQISDSRRTNVKLC